jgi:hypothetical protein
MRNELTLCKGPSSGSAFNLGALHYTKSYHMWRSLTMGIGVALLIRYLTGIPKPRLSFHIDKTNNYYFS